MSWTYQGIIVETLPEECISYVYLITNVSSGRKYIGKKLAKFSKTTYKTVKLKNGTKKKKKIRSKVDSDWRDYYGSSPNLQKDIDAYSMLKKDYEDIIDFHYTKIYFPKQFISYNKSHFNKFIQKEKDKFIW